MNSMKNNLIFHLWCYDDLNSFVELEKKIINIEEKIECNAQCPVLYIYPSWSFHAYIRKFGRKWFSKEA